LLYIVLTKQYGYFKVTKKLGLFFRVLVGVIGLFLTFGTAQILPLANATVLFFLSTLLIPVFAHVFLKETIGIHRIMAVIFGMTGVVLVARPTLEMSVIGVVCALSAACCHATIQTLMRHLRTESPVTTTFYFLLGGTLIPALGIPWLFTMPTGYNVWGLLITIGISGGLGQYFLASGFKNAQASLLSPFNYTGLLWATGFDILIWGAIPSFMVYVGGTIIVASKLYIVHREHKNAVT
jgi:drug/metabolite transporter (DMT)-like permease